MAITQDQIDEVIASAACCLATKNSQRIRATWNGEDVTCAEYDILDLVENIEVLARFTPPGTVLTPAYVGTATLDIGAAGITPFPETYSGTVVVNGTIIAVIAGDFTDEADLIQAIVDAINNNTGSTGYSAVNNGDGTITLTAVGGASFAILSATFTLFSYYIFAVADFDTDVGAVPMTLSSDGTGINVISYGNGGNTAVDALLFNYAGDDVATDLFPGLEFLNPGTVPGAPDAWYIPAFGSAYFPDRNLLYFMFFDSISSFDTVSGTITVECNDMAGTLGGDSCVTGRYQGAGIIYNPFYQQLFFTMASNGLGTIDATGAISIAVPSFTGSNFSLTCNTQNGDLFIAPNTTTFVVRVQDPLGTPILSYIPVPGDCGQNTQRITYRPGTTTANGRIFYTTRSVRANMIQIINPVTNVVVEYDASAVGEVSNGSTSCVYWSEQFNLLFVGATTGILLYAYDEATPNTLIFIQRFDLANEAEVSTLVKFNDNTTTSDGGSVMYIGNPGVNIDTYGIIKQTSPFEVEGTLGAEIPPVLSDDSINCIDDPSTIISNIKKMCGCCNGTGSTTSEAAQLVLAGNAGNYIDANGNPILVIP